MGSDKPKAKPALSTRIKRWYEGDRDEGDAVLLLSELEEKERRKKPKNPGKRSRKKGQLYQKSIEHALAVVYPEAKSASQYLGGKREGSDVQGTPYFVECKDHKKIAIPAWWKQADDDRKEMGCEGEIAVVFNLAGTSLVCITLEEFVRLHRGVMGRPIVGPDKGVYKVLERDDYDPSRFDTVGLICIEGSGFEARRADTSLIRNPRKGSDGLWSTLDAAEAAVRKASNVRKRSDFATDEILAAGLAGQAGVA